MLIKYQPGIWYVLKTKSNREKIVVEDLEKRKIENYWPRKKKKGTRIGMVRNVPIFPGYVFVKPQENQLKKMQYIRGSSGILALGNSPGKLTEDEITSIKELINASGSVKRIEEIPKGKRIQILEGSLKGVEGEIFQIKSEKNLIIKIEVIGKLISLPLKDMIFKVLP